MLHQPIRADHGTIELIDELDRARRVALTLNNPNDQRIIESYIAELEFSQSADARKSAPVS